MRGHDDHPAALSDHDGGRAGAGDGRGRERSPRDRAPLSEPAELAWLAEFERTHGRRLRVLHIGNIANNAYNNAKIQRQRRIDADVACFDYYHVMGCPEWEDAEFEGDYGDPFYPDWWRVRLNGFARPDWFAQGPLKMCIRYLRAGRRGHRLRAALYGRLLLAQRWLRCRTSTAAEVAGFLGGVLRTTRAQAVYGFSWIRSVTRTAGRKTVASLRAVVALAGGAGWRNAALIVFPRRLAHLRPAGAGALSEAAQQLDPARLSATTYDVGIFDRFRAHFPERELGLVPDDVGDYARAAQLWSRLLAEYDVVQAYSTDPIIPVLCKFERFTAYEHGTLREIPFEDSPRGRLCALAYREAPVVFVTNSDVVPSARRLGLAEDQLVFLPHAVDGERMFRFVAEHAEVAPPRDVVTIYAPSRQDWVDGDVSWSKGNDRFFRAAASLAGAYAFRLVLAEWGRDLDASRTLLDELGITERIDWVPPLRKRELWLRYLSSHVVVDQFTVPAIGGVTFEAMALGRRVITALDREQTAEFFGRTPPVLAAESVDEIAAALETVLQDPGDEAGRGAEARNWYAECHSPDRTVALQVAAYRRLLAASDA